ncbi:MAG: response regulator transcription factor [Verrucomicrobia bacterium]|nr:response regulator transcription factor [Verrucomicrobiota bacterium]
MKLESDGAAIRIVIADDHQWVREGFRGALHRPPRTIVEGLASDAQELLALIQGKPPDVVLLDHAFGGDDGLELIARMAPWIPPERVLLVTAWEHSGTQALAKQAGLGGFLLKKADDTFLRSAVETVGTGRRFFPDEYPQPPAALSRRRWNDLSHSEWAVLRALCAAKSPKMAAQRLGDGYSSKTVSNHLQSIYGKLVTRGFKNVMELYLQEGFSKDPAQSATRND